jgi:polysaccharide biosynthesis transport protein
MVKTVETADRETHADDLDLRALGAAIRRKRAWIVIPTLAGLIAAGCFVAFVKPRYQAEAQVLLENQENFLTRPERTEGPHELSSGPDQESVASQVQLVTSRDLGRRAILALHLVGNPEFDPYAHGLGPMTQILVLLGLARDPMRIPPEDRVLENYLDRLTVFSPTKTRVLTIDFRASDPDLAAKAANEIAKLYLEMQSEAKRNAAKGAAASLAAEITDLRGKVTRAESDVEQFRASNGLLAGTNNMTIVGQQLAELNSELAKARTNEADAKARATLIRDILRQGKTGDVADIANNDLVRRISEQRVLAKSQLALESRTLLPGHPRIKELVAQMADLDAELRATAEKIARALENDAKVAAARVANLEAAIEQQKQSVTIANTDDVHLRELERIAQGYRAQLESSMTKYQEAIGRENSPATPADARIIARASVPQEPAFPKKVPTLLFGAIAGFILSLGGVVSSELLGARAARQDAEAMRSSREGRVEIELLPQIKERSADKASEPVRAHAEESDAPPNDDEAAQSAQAMRRLWELPPRDEGKGLRIVAAALEDDAAAAARIIEFARELTQQGRAIIVDLDPQSTRLAGLFGDRPQTKLGLSDLGKGKASFSEVIHRDHASRLHFVACGTAADCQSADLDLIFDALLQTYDFLVVAAPALEESMLASELAPLADLVALAAPREPDETTLAVAVDALYAQGAADVVVLDAGSLAASDMRCVA